MIGILRLADEDMLVLRHLDGSSSHEYEHCSQILAAHRHGNQFQEGVVRGHRRWKLQSAHLLVGTVVDDHLKVRRYGERFSGQWWSIFCAQLIGIDLAEQSCRERDAHQNRNPGSPPHGHEFSILW